MTWILSLILLLILATHSSAQSWTAVYAWDAQAGATSYKVEKSTDNGTTWTVVASPTSPTFTYTGNEQGLVLIRVSACNANGCAVRSNDGFWHNQAWAPPGMPANVKVQ